MNSRLDELLVRHRWQLIDGVVHRLESGRATRYRHVERADLRGRVERLHAELRAGLRSGTGGFVGYAEGLARARYAEGFGLADVQTALSEFEEQIWRLVVVHAPRDEQVELLAWVTGLVGAAKDRLAQVYLEQSGRASRPGDGDVASGNCWRGTDPAPMSEEDRDTASSIPSRPAGRTGRVPVALGGGLR